MNTQSIGKEKATELFESEWWKDLDDRSIAKFQLLTDELCCPFSVFHGAIGRTLNRPVFTHEFGSAGREQLILELFGEADAPSLQDIINMIPEEKRIILIK